MLMSLLKFGITPHQQCSALNRTPARILAGSGRSSRLNDAKMEANAAQMTFVPSSEHEIHVRKGSP